ncbi:MAG: His/Gly/Thr/Pro-type tRNA ligase C-terminal domain-containing protein, partial [Candidatus Micrarchaeota archaeon]
KVKHLAQEIKDSLVALGVRASIDLTDKTPGFKFNWWEMKGVPFRIELGEREVAENSVTLALRHNREKIKVPIDQLHETLIAKSTEMLSALSEKSLRELNSQIKIASTKEEAKKILDEKGFAKLFICSMEMDGKPCAEDLKEVTKGGKVRGTRLEEKPESGKCIVCQRDGIRVYFARQY